MYGLDATWNELEKETATVPRQALDGWNLTGSWVFFIYRRHLSFLTRSLP